MSCWVCCVVVKQWHNHQPLYNNLFNTLLLYCLCKRNFAFSNGLILCVSRLMWFWSLGDNTEFLLWFTTINCRCRSVSNLIVCGTSEKFFFGFFQISWNFDWQVAAWKKVMWGLCGSWWILMKIGNFLEFQWKLEISWNSSEKLEIS